LAAADSKLAMLGHELGNLDRAPCAPLAPRFRLPRAEQEGRAIAQQRNDQNHDQQGRRAERDEGSAPA